MTRLPSGRLGREQGMTLVELLIVIIILGILTTVAVTGLLRARVSSNEASAIASLRAVYSAQFTYTAGCGAGSYAIRLTDLTRVPPGGTVGYLSQDLAGSDTPQRNGYEFNLGPGLDGEPGPPDCNGSATRTRYYAATRPVALGTTGTRSFAITSAGTVWQAQGAAPPPEPFGPPATTVQQ
jgi:type IV pilus assembly protein PilA